MYSSTHPGSAAGLVAGVDVGGTKIGVAVARPDGSILARRRLPTDVRHGVGPAVRRVAAAVAELRAEHAPGAELDAVGLVVPGVVQEGRVLLAPNLPGWEQTDVVTAFRTALGVSRLSATNDVRAGALAEARMGALRGSPIGLYLNVGTGLAAALVVDGTVVTGAHQAAGEIGFTRPTGALGAWVGTGHAHLEAAVSGAALAARAANVLGEELDAAELFRRTDPVAQHLVHEALGALGTALVNLSVFVDPDRIVVGGGLAASADVVVPVLQAYLRSGVPFPPDVVVGAFPGGASLQGAVALAVDLLARAEAPA